MRNGRAIRGKGGEKRWVNLVHVLISRVMKRQSNSGGRQSRFNEKADWREAGSSIVGAFSPPFGTSHVLDLAGEE
jgi:hypothetical protein